MSRRAFFIAAAVVVSSLIASADAVPNPHAATAELSRPAMSQTVERAFGYEVGEERRYRLGPPEALIEGEQATWLVRLDRMVGRGQDLRATFAFEHHRERGAPGHVLPQPGDLVSAAVEGTLTVNAYGFPLEVDFTLSHHYHGYGDEVFGVRYAFDGEYYVKEVWLEGESATAHIPIAHHKHLDRSVPTGLFLFLPESVSCGVWQIDAGLPSRYDPWPSFAFQPTSPQDCSESDPAFANPGFLSLVLPALWEARGERSFLFLTPTPPEFLPGGNVGFGFAAPGVSVRSQASGGSGRQRARNLRRQYRPVRLVAEDRTEVEVGGRKMEAIRIHLSGSTAHFAYVDDEGKVLRIDLDPSRIAAGAQGVSTRFGAEAIWIRLMFPSEY